MEEYSLESLSDKNENGTYILKDVCSIWKYFYDIESNDAERLLEELSIRQDMSTRIANVGPSGSAKSTGTALPLTVEINALYHNGISPTQTSKIHNVVSCLYNDTPLTTVVIKYRSKNKILQKLMSDTLSVIADKIIASHCQLKAEDIKEIVNNVITPSKAVDYNLSDCMEPTSIAQLMKEIQKITEYIVGVQDDEDFLEHIVKRELKKVDEEKYAMIRKVYEQEISKRIAKYENDAGEKGEQVLFRGVLDILDVSVENVERHMSIKLEKYKRAYPNCIEKVGEEHNQKYIIVFENSNINSMQDVLSDIYINNEYSVLIECIQYFTPANDIFMQTFENECEMNGRDVDEDGYMKDISPINGIMCTLSDTRGTDDARADGDNSNEALDTAIRIIRQTNPDSTYMYLNIMNPTANFHKIYEAVKRQTKSEIKIIVTHIDDFIKKYVSVERKRVIGDDYKRRTLGGHKARLTARQKAMYQEESDYLFEDQVVNVKDFSCDEIISGLVEIEKRLKINGFDVKDVDIVKISLVKSECQEVIDNAAKDSCEIRKLIGGDGKLYSPERFFREIYSTVGKHYDKYQSVNSMEGVEISINCTNISALAKKCKERHLAVISSGLKWEENHGGRCAIDDEKNFYFKYRNYNLHWKTKEAVMRYNAIGEGWYSNARVFVNININIPSLCRSFISIDDIRACINAKFDQTIRIGEQKLVNEALCKNLSAYQSDLKRKISIMICDTDIGYYGFNDLLEKCCKLMSSTEYWEAELTKAFIAIAERMSYITLR